MVLWFLSVSIDTDHRQCRYASINHLGVSRVCTSRYQSGQVLIFHWNFIKGIFSLDQSCSCFVCWWMLFHRKLFIVSGESEHGFPAGNPRPSVETASCIRTVVSYRPLVVELGDCRHILRTTQPSSVASKECEVAAIFIRNETLHY